MSDKKHIAARASLIEQLVSQRDFEDLGSHLTELETLQVTKEHLQETDVTRAVHRVLKNCPTVSLRRRVKHLLSDWKALYQPQDSPSSFPVGGEKEGSPGLALDPRQQESVGVSISDSLPLPQDVLTEATKTPGNGAGQVGPPEKQFRRGSDKRASELLGPTAPVRTKCTELLYEALAASSAGQPTATLRRDFARQIEEHVFTLHSKNLKKYKTCIRSKIANLKNPRNSHLHQNLLSGTVSPREFAEMSVLEMASEELKCLRASYTQACIQEHRLPHRAEGTHTAQIRCRRCEKFNCDVTTIARGTLFLPSWVQNSSPDEEMLTYVICNECGEQWYLNKWVCL